MMGMDEASLRRLVHAFYERVRADEQIGSVFEDAIEDWPAHLETLTAFWSSVMLGSGRYKGRPVPAHVRHRARIEPASFTRWLELWRETTQELMTPDDAAALQERAGRIGESLQLALFYRLPPAAAE